MQTVLSLPHTCSLRPLQTLWCSLFPPTCAFFFPPSLSFPPFLPVLPSLSAIFCPASLHAWPALLWLLTSKSYFIHQSLIRKRGPFSAALKEREGTRNECIKKEKKKEYALGGRGISVWKEGTREKADPLLTAGDLGSHKSKKRDMLPHIHTPMQSPCQHLNKLSHTCFPSCWVCADASCTFPSIVFCQSPFSLSVFFFCLLILLIWASGAEGASSPVPSVIPSLHLGIFFSQIFSTRPLATISKSVFSVFSLHWCSLTFSLFFSHSSVFWGGWQASFQVSGNCYCLPSQLESGSHSTAYKHTRTHRYAHLLFILLFYSLL